VFVVLIKFNFNYRKKSYIKSTVKINLSKCREEMTSLNIYFFLYMVGSN